RARLDFGELRVRVANRLLQEFLALGRRQRAETGGIAATHSDEVVDECLLEGRCLIFDGFRIRFVGHTSIMRAGNKGSSKGRIPACASSQQCSSRPSPS